MEILVLYGGESEERAVSLCSGERVCDALRQKGHTVMGVDARGAVPSASLIEKAQRVDVVFLCFHGGAGEDGRWQAALEKGGIFHYTGSDERASALAMDKPLAKAQVMRLGVPCAKGVVWRAGTPRPSLALPCVIKPPSGGSSIGFRVIDSADEWEKLAPLGDLLCESYLPGREYSVGVLEKRALPPIEILPLGGVYDYAHKYTQNATRELCPAPVSPSKLAKLQDLALICFGALGLRDFARIDFKEDAAGEICFLEANTLPGMTHTSLLPLAASVCGLDFTQLCEQIAELAAQRKVWNT